MTLSFTVYMGNVHVRSCGSREHEETDMFTSRCAKHLCAVDNVSCMCAAYIPFWSCGYYLDVPIILLFTPIAYWNIIYGRGLI